MADGVEYFPQIIGPNTLIGRLNSGTGPAEAIPFEKVVQSPAFRPLSPSIRSFGAKGDGVTDDSGATRKMLTKLGYAVIPDDGGLYYMATCVDVGANQRVTGGGKVKAGEFETAAFRIVGSYGEVSDLRVDINGAYAAVVGHGVIQQPTIKRCHATGYVQPGGAHFGFYGDATGATDLMFGPIAEDNSYDGFGYDNGYGGHIFEACIDFVASRLVVRNQGNHFGLQTKWSSGVIFGFDSYTPDAGSTITATASQKIFIFNMANDKICPKIGVHINGVPKTPTAGGYTATPNGDYTQWTIEFTVGRSVNDKIRLVTRGNLEALNINTASSVVIDDYTINGQDDGGIVFGADYRWNGTAYEIGSPSQNDLTFNCTVGAGSVRNVHNAAIASVTFTRGLTLSGGHKLREWANQADTDGVFDNAIMIAYGSLQVVDETTTIMPGVIDNTSGFGNGGVWANPALDNGDPNKALKLFRQDYRGSFPNGRENVRAIAVALAVGISHGDRPARLWPTQPDFLTAFTTAGKPTDGNGWTYIKSGDGCTQSDAASGAPYVGNGEKVIAARSLQTIPAGGIQMAITGGEALARTVVGLRMLAKSQANPLTATATRITIAVQFPDTTTQTFTYCILNTDFRWLEFTTAMLGTARLYSIYIECPTGGVVANIEEFQLIYSDAII